MHFHNLLRVCLWSVVSAGSFLLCGASQAYAGDKKGGPYRLQHVEVRRSYYNFGREEKILTPIGVEIVKGRPGKLEMAANQARCTSKYVLHVDAPDSVMEGESVTITGTVDCTVDVRDKELTTDINFGYSASVSFMYRSEEKNVFASAKKPLPLGVNTLKVSKSRTVVVGSEDRLFQTYLEQKDGARYAQFRVTGGGGADGNHGMSMETLWVYRQEPQGKTPDPKPNTKPGELDIAVTGGMAAGEPLTVTATVHGQAAGQPLRLQIPAGLEFVSGQEIEKLPAGRNSVSWKIRAARPGQFEVRVHLGNASRVHTLNIHAAPEHPPGKLPPLPPHVQQQIEQLRQRAQTHNWHFQIGQTGVSHYSLAQLCGFRLPPGINYLEYARRVNQQGAQWLKADRQARIDFNTLHPNVLPELQVEARTQPDVYATKNRFDWRDYGKVPPIRMQGQCGSCWDFAAIGAFESSYLIRNNEAIRASEQQILDCAKSNGCGGGYQGDAFDYLIQRGSSPGSAYPYTATKGASCKMVTSPYRAVSWGLVDPSGGLPSVAAMKQALCQHGPLAVCVNATPAFHNYTGGVFDEYDPGTDSNHVVVIVGWDDSKGKNGCWALRNSWDTTWGEQGYMWIEYGCNIVGSYAAWVEAQSVHYSLMTLAVNDYRVKQGQDVYAPIQLLNPTNVNNMDWVLNFDASVAKLVEPSVLDGNIPLLAFLANPAQPNRLLLSFAQHKPINTSGQLARIHFKAVGAPGSRTPLTLEVETISDPKQKPLAIKLIHGSIEIVKDDDVVIRPRGSCCGQPKLVMEDAFCALEMSVQLRPEDKIMDMNFDNKVNSDDAAIIIQRVMDATRTGQ